MPNMASILKIMFGEFGIKNKGSFLFLALSGIAVLPLISQDWPMWGGTAQRNLTSAMKNLPESWDVKSGKNIKWKAPIGSASYGNPIVADGKIFLGTNNENPKNPEIRGDKGVLLCFRESDGKFLWQAVSDKLESGSENDFPEQGVCSSPAVDGKRLYYVSNRGELICLDTEGFIDGKNDGPFQDEVHKGPTDADIIWKLDMMKELGVWQRFMANSSPVIWEDLVFIETSNGRADEKIPAPKAPSFIAVNKNTGKVWQYDKINRSISTAAICDGLAYISDLKGILHCLDARTGKPYWTFDILSPVWGSPLVVDGKVYLGDADGDVVVLKTGAEIGRPLLHQHKHAQTRLE
jgi:outer membrane protein assembly factor BamB